MALQQMAWFGSTPIGALLMGWVIQISSPRVPFAVGGLATITCATSVRAHPSRRQARRRHRRHPVRATGRSSTGGTVTWTARRAHDPRASPVASRDRDAGD